MRSGNDSPADSLIRTLKTFVPKYDKADPDVISSFAPLTGSALVNAAKAFAAATAAGNFNPSTEVHSLVAKLQAFTSPNSPFVAA